MLNVYLTRHVRTEYNELNIMMGRGHGKPLIKKHAAFFEEKMCLFSSGLNGPVAIYSSPAERCVMTSEIISRVIGYSKKVTVVENLNETDYGQFEGLPPNIIRERYPREYNAWIHKPEVVVFPGGESFSDAQKRTFNVFKELSERHFLNTSHVFLVTHVDNIKLLLFKFLGVSIAKKRGLDIGNASISHIKFHPNITRVSSVNT